MIQSDCLIYIFRNPLPLLIHTTCNGQSPIIIPIRKQQQIGRYGLMTDYLYRNHDDTHIMPLRPSHKHLIL